MSLSPRAILLFAAMLLVAGWWFTREPDAEPVAEAPTAPPVDPTAIEPRSAAGAQVEAMRAAAQGAADGHAERIAAVEEATE